MEKFSLKREERVVSIIGVFIITVTLCTFVSYNAGKGDGKKEMFQTIAKCTVKDAHDEKCFIPCSEDNDCYMKNGLADY